MKLHTVSMALLLDFYGELLPQKQRSYMDAYYDQDLSLAEIAENEGVSRQGVHDALKRAEAALEDYEKKLGCAEKLLHRKSVAAELRNAAEQADETLRPVLDRAVQALED